MIDCLQSIAETNGWSKGGRNASTMAGACSGIQRQWLKCVPIDSDAFGSDSARPGTYPEQFFQALPVLIVSHSGL
jgi:hypothetical protein